MDEITAYIGLGSNMGDRQRALSQAIRQISETQGIHAVRQSTIVETKPVGPVQDQPDFLNSVIEVKTTLSALELLDAMLSVESSLGRLRTPNQRWGPRTIDLDVLLYGNQCIDDPRLKVPHPEISNRPFVLSGLAELGAPV